MTAPAACYPVTLIPAPAVIETVATTLGLSVDDLRGMRRSHSLHFARCIAALLITDHTLLSQVELGHALGRKASSAGSDLMASALSLRGDDERFRAALEQCRQRVLQWSDSHV
jgi:chromosomal replication initiation ATPase DnaA